MATSKHKRRFDEGGIVEGENPSIDDATRARALAWVRAREQEAGEGVTPAEPAALVRAAKTVPVRIAKVAPVTDSDLDYVKAKRSVVDQIPTGGSGKGPTPPAEESDEDNSEFARNVRNTLNALPGIGALARAGNLAKAASTGKAATAAKDVGRALSVEREITPVTFLGKSRTGDAVEGGAKALGKPVGRLEAPTRALPRPTERLESPTRALPKPVERVQKEPEALPAPKTATAKTDEPSGKTRTPPTRKTTTRTGGRGVTRRTRKLTEDEVGEGFSRGGSVSRRVDGIAQRGKTRGKVY